MKIQMMLLALPAIAAARACPAKKHRTSSIASILTPAVSSTVSIADASSVASVVPSPPSIAPVLVSKSSSTTSVVASEPTSTASAVLSATSTKAAVVVATSSSPSSSSSSSLSSSSDAVSGTSTFYGGNLSGGTCSFTTLSKIPSGLYGTAFSGSAWDNAAECGACLKVTGPNGNSITVMVSTPLPPHSTDHTPKLKQQVVDECPECDEGHLDLFEDAFEQLGSTSAGEIATSYTKVACGISSPIVLHNKSGTSAYWFSMQVVNSNEPISSLEVSTDGGSTWQSTTRTEYNFFENSSGFGTDTVDVRVTSTSGGTITVSDVSVAANAQVTASSNFS
ncbi:hypothetical protein VPNG_07724 [Cytospora leucostoma]|uniref:Expansin-like EG45 domain-containing protein n=1 Tax=Cytospora leucostoma TaxID=1230097 RepID=A0A423W894_9PEZI|nr:hypothetical protein VPNG_07724 [Cytospora leucostoma]